MGRSLGRRGASRAASPGRRWQSYLASGEERYAFGPGLIEGKGLRLAVDAAVACENFFFVEGWLLGSETQEFSLAAEARGGRCETAAFRYGRFDVNDAFGLPRAAPHESLGFRLFGRLAAGSQGARVIGMRVSVAGAAGALFTIPLTLQPEGAGAIWRPLLRSLRQNPPIAAADREAAGQLLAEMRAGGLAPSLRFPEPQGEAFDLLILARRRPDTAKMNATLLQQILPGSARIFLAAADWDAAEQLGEGSVALPTPRPASLHYVQTSESLSSAALVGRFLASPHAPTVIVVVDDVFVAPCLGEMEAAVAEGRPLFVRCRRDAARFGAAVLPPVAGDPPPAGEDPLEALYRHWGEGSLATTRCADLPRREAPLREEAQRDQSCAS